MLKYVLFLSLLLLLLTLGDSKLPVLSGSFTKIVTRAPTLHNSTSFTDSKVAKTLLVSCSILYASNYGTLKSLQKFWSPSQLSFARFGVGGGIFIPYLWRNRSKIDFPMILHSVELGLWCALGFYFQSIALARYDASKVALFCSLGVMFSPLLSLISAFTNKSSTKKLNIHYHEYLAAFVAFIGSIFVDWNERGSLYAPSNSFLLLIPFCFSMYFWRAETLAVEYPKDSFAITGLMLNSVSVFFLGWYLFDSNIVSLSRNYHGLMQQYPFHMIAGLLYTSLSTTAFTALVEQISLRSVGSSNIALYYSAEPIFSALFSLFFHHEIISWNLWTGGILITTACLLENLNWKDIMSYFSRSRRGLNKGM